MMWSVQVTTADGRELRIEWDAAKRIAAVVVELTEPMQLADGRTITSVRVPIPAESWRSVARVIQGWPL